MIIGTIELISRGGSLVSGDTSNSVLYPFIFWVIVVFTAGYFEYYANKKVVDARNADKATDDK